MKISFYHCKAANTTRPSAAISDLKVLEQAIRSIVWVRNPDLMHEIINRSDGTHRPDSYLVKGTINTVKSIAKQFYSNKWSYEVLIVHPGLDCKEMLKKQSTNTLLLNCYEWLYSQDVTLIIMGFCPNKKK